MDIMIGFLAGIFICFLFRPKTISASPERPQFPAVASYFYERQNGKKFNEVITVELCNMLELDDNNIKDDLSEITALLSDDKMKLEAMVAQLNHGNAASPIVIYVPKQNKYYECTGTYRGYEHKRDWIEIWFRDITSIRDYFMDHGNRK